MIDKMVQNEEQKSLVFTNVGLLHVLRGIPDLSGNNIFKILKAVDSEAIEVTNDLDEELEEALNAD